MINIGTGAGNIELLCFQLVFKIKVLVISNSEEGLFDTFPYFSEWNPNEYLMRHDDSFHNNERDQNEKFVNLFQQESPDNNNQATKCQVRPTQSTNNNPISNQQLSSNQQVQINNQQPTIKHQIIVNNHTNKINTTNKQLIPNDVLIDDDLVNVSYNSDNVIVGEWENNHVTKGSLASLQPRTWI